MHVLVIRNLSYSLLNLYLKYFCHHKKYVILLKTHHSSLKQHFRRKKAETKLFSYARTGSCQTRIVDTKTLDLYSSWNILHLLGNSLQLVEASVVSFPQSHQGKYAINETAYQNLTKLTETPMPVLPQPFCEQSIAKQYRKYH